MAQEKDPKTPAPKTVAEDMANRRVFATPEEAAEYLTASGQAYSDFGNIALAAPGIDDQGQFDPAIYNESTDTMVALLRNKSAVKCIVVGAVPKIPVILGMTAEDWASTPEAQRSWVERILHKELNHVLVRPLRDAEDVSTVIDQMPTTLEGFITSGRDAGAGIMESFNELYKPVNATMASKLPVWAKARLIKSELKRAFENKGYAAEFYPALEGYQGKGAESGLFVAALHLAINAAKRKGMDPTIFERWLSTRDSKTFTPGEEEDDSLDLDNMMTSLLGEEGGEDTDTQTDADTSGDTNTDAATDSNG